MGNEVYETYSITPWAEQRIRTSVQKLITNIDSSLTLCDVGAGSGYLVDLFNSLGFRAVGVDKYPQRNDIEFIDILKPIQSAQHFDVLTLFHVLEHFSDPKFVLQNLVNAFSPQFLLIAVPNAMVDGAYKPFDKGIGHYYYFTKETLVDLLGEFGKVVSIQEVKHNDAPDGKNFNELLAKVKVIL